MISFEWVPKILGVIVFFGGLWLALWLIVKLWRLLLFAATIGVLLLLHDSEYREELEAFVIIAGVVAGGIALYEMRGAIWATVLRAISACAWQAGLIARRIVRR